MYLTFNKDCDQCDHENFILSHNCKSYWRHQYTLNDCPFSKNQEYANINCRVLKALISRQILNQIAVERLVKLRKSMCFNGTHALKLIKKNKEYYVCDLCSQKVAITSHCGKMCLKHKQYTFTCLYPIPANGKQVPHRCYCICCMSLMSENDTMKTLRKDLGFYLGLKP